MEGRTMPEHERKVLQSRFRPVKDDKFDDILRQLDRIPVSAG